MSPRPDQSDDPTPDPAEGTPSAGAAERIIEKFGGIRPMAHKLEIPVTTVQGWKKRGAIPTARHPDLIAAAARHAIPLDPEELAAAAPSEEPAAEPAADAPPAGEPAPDRHRPVEEVEETVTAEGTEERVPEEAPPPAAAATTTGTPPARRGGARSVAVAAMLLSLLALGTALTAPWWAGELLAPTFGEPRPPAAVAALETRVDDLAARLETAAGLQTGATGLAGAVDALESRLAEVAETARQAAEAARQASEQVADLAAGDGEALATRIGEVERDVEQRLAELASRLPEQPVGAAQLEQQLQPLRAALERNAQAISVLETEANRLSSELSDAVRRVAGLAEAVERRQTADADTQALVLAAGQLRAALQGSGDFLAELRTLRQLGVDDPEIADALSALAPHAEEGIPTRPELADRFSRLAPEIVRAGRTTEGGEWYDRALDRVSSLVSVRRVGGDVTGDDAAAVVARAEAMVEGGDLDGGVAELAALQGPAAEAAGPWLAQTRARLLADRAAAALTRHAIGRLAGFDTTSNVTGNAPEGGTVQQ